MEGEELIPFRRRSSMFGSSPHTSPVLSIAQMKLHSLRTATVWPTAVPGASAFLSS